MKSTSLTMALALMGMRVLTRVVDLAGPSRIRRRVHVANARLHAAAFDQGVESPR